MWSVGQGLGNRLLAGHIHVLALAGEGAMGMGKHGSSRSRSGAVEVKVRKAHPQRGPVAVAGEVHKASQSHAHKIGGFVVGVGTIPSESGDRHHDQGWVDGGQVLIAQPLTIQVSGRIGFDQEVSLFHQLL